MGSKVSIITPVYNCEKYIVRCIESLLKQTYMNIEIIMVDDGSKDKSAQIIKEYAKITDKIKYLYQNNSGPGVARNKAIKEANGKYIMFVDADDYIEKDYVKSMVDIAERNNSELVIGGYTLVYENGKKDRVVIPEYYERNFAEEWAYRISACCSRLYSREFWNRNDIRFNEERKARAEDVPIVLFSNVMAKNIEIVKNAGYYYYQHESSAMNNRSKKVNFEFPYKAFKEIYNKVIAGELENSVQYFNIGVLKFLAQFRYVIYLRANREEKIKFFRYTNKVLNNSFEKMDDDWKKRKKEIKLPCIHKLAIEVFILEYKHRVKIHAQSK